MPPDSEYVCSYRTVKQDQTDEMELDFFKIDSRREMEEMMAGCSLGGEIEKWRWRDKGFENEEKHKNKKMEAKNGLGQQKGKYDGRTCQKLEKHRMKNKQKQHQTQTPKMCQAFKLKYLQYSMKPQCQEMLRQTFTLWHKSIILWCQLSGLFKFDINQNKTFQEEVKGENPQIDIDCRWS